MPIEIGGGKLTATNIEAVMSRYQFQVLATDAVENITSTFQQYASAIHEELPFYREVAKSYAYEAYGQTLALYESQSPSPWAILGTLLVFYLTLVQLFRFRSVRKQNRKYISYLKNPYKLDYKTAHPIMRRIMLYEAPWLYGFSTEMALVKTYAVAPGTELLVATRQLTQESTVGKRAEDTGVILTEFVVGEMDSERGMKALAKMNWLHRRYGSRIRRDEMLFTLAMFVLEPMRWFEMYEWRPMTELEKVAIYTYWKEIGSRMGIENLPPTLEDLEIWTEEYTSRTMYYSDNNRACAEATLGLFVRDLPAFMQNIAKNALISLLEDRVRIALGYEKQAAPITFLTSAVFKIRGFLIRHFYLPRFSELDVLPKIDKSNRLHRTLWAFEPWYVKASMWETLKAWISTKGKVLPGPKYRSSGTLVEELGPAAYEKISIDDVRREAEQIRKYAAGGGAVGLGCPFKLR